MPNSFWCRFSLDSSKRANLLSFLLFRLLLTCFFSVLFLFYLFFFSSVLTLTIYQPLTELGFLFFLYFLFRLHFVAYSRPISILGYRFRQSRPVVRRISQNFGQNANSGQRFNIQAFRRSAGLFLFWAIFGSGISISILHLILSIKTDSTILRQ